MAVSTAFNEELAAVDAGKSFSYVLNAETYGQNEYSVSGYTVTGGSEHAQAQGAERALHNLGFRHYSPQRTHRPETLPAEGVTIAKRENAMPFTRMFLNYGFDAGSATASAAFVRWQTLNNLADQRRTVGQTWLSIINGINAQDGFFTNNPDNLYKSDTFLIDDGSVEAANADRVGAYIAGLLTASGGNFQAFGVSDGSPYSSDEIVRFSNAVISKVRETVPDAILGVLAYATAAAPPSIDCPDLYAQVALGFGSAGLGYPALIAGWGARTGGIGLRAYGDIGAWDGFLPMSDGIRRRNYWVSSHPLADYLSDGANSINMETSANFAKNIVSHYHTLRFWKDGNSDYETICAEIVNNIYDGDEAVYDLFLFLADNSLSDVKYLGACDLIDEMPDTWYRLEFRQMMALAIQHRRLRYRTASHSGQYFSRLEQNLRWWRGLRDGGFHSYVYERQLANANTGNNGRPDLSFDAGPHWRRYPVAPTDADYIALRDDLTARVTARLPAEVANQDDMVVVDVMPTGSAGSSESVISTKAYCQTRATIYAQGPGDLIITPTDTTLAAETYELPSGLYSFDVPSGFVAEFESGLLWIDAYDGTSYDYSTWPFTPQQNYWLYVPKIVRGKIDMRCGVRLTIYDSGGQHDIKEQYPPFTESPNPDPNTILPGVCRVQTSLIRGVVFLGNVNRYFSLHPRKMLMPKALAKAEFPSISFGRAE